MVWVNEEDHMRIISMDKGGNLYEVFLNLFKGLEAIEHKLDFAHDKRRGYLTSCPTNIGTTIRASVHIKLPKLSSQPNFKKICKSLNLDVRGIDGEHSEGQRGIFDISNKTRFGISEKDILANLVQGIKHLIELEKSLEYHAKLAA